MNKAGGVFFSKLLDTSECDWNALYEPIFDVFCSARNVWPEIWWMPICRGSITNLTSIEGVRAAPGYAAYAAAKAGVINYTETAAFELAPHGIRVNAIAPDLTLAEGLMRLTPQGPGTVAGQAMPQGRAGRVDDIAGTAMFLASDMSGYITGQTIHVDGGTQAAGGWYHHPGSRGFRLGPSGQ